MTISLKINNDSHFLGLPMVVEEVVSHSYPQHIHQLFNFSVNNSHNYCRASLQCLLAHYSGQHPYESTSTKTIGTISSVKRASRLTTISKFSNVGAFAQ